MTHFELFESQPSITLDDLKIIQKQYNIVFPEDYINLILSHNGSYTNKTLYEGDKESLAFASIFPIKYGGYTFEMALEQCRNTLLLPEYLLPIGDDAAGDFVCISQAKETFGYVYKWVHDTAHDPVRLVATSLTEILSNLKEYNW